MHAWHHAVSSANKFGGKPTDYVAIHNFFDASKSHTADRRHRFLRHHSEGIFQAEEKFGLTITNSNGRQVPVRFIGEQHVMEDLGRIPTVADWAASIQLQPWMQRPGINREDREALEAMQIPEEGYIGEPGLELQRLTVLDVSTTHITLKDSQNITLNPHLMSYEDKHGWWIHVPELLVTEESDNTLWADLVADGLSGQFIDLLRQAQLLGCSYVRLDSDGPVYSRWHVNDW